MEATLKPNSFIRLKRKPKIKDLTLNKYLPWIIGFGVVSFGFLSNIIAVGIIATLGVFVGFLALAWLLITNRSKIRTGSKVVYIPLLIIGISMIISNLQSGLANMILTPLLAVYFFGLYLAVGVLGKQILKIFSLAVILEAISVVVIALVFGVRNGGIALYTDYNIAVGILVFGSFLAIGQKQWIVFTVAAVGLFFTGAEEGLVAMVIILIAMLIRRDFQGNNYSLQRLIVPVGLIVVIAGVGLFPIHYTWMLYAPAIDKVSILISGHHLAILSQYSVLNPDGFNLPGDYLLDGRVALINNGLNHLSLFGSGYRRFPILEIDFPIHNVPLVIVQQVGPVSALAWVFVTIYSFIKSHWKYAFIALFALCLFDNFMWCQIGTWWWLLIGLAAFVPIKSDLIFKAVKT